MISLRRLAKRVVGPRDWYRIDHWKNVDGDPSFRVEVHIWHRDHEGRERESAYDATDYSLTRAVNIVLFNIASPGTI